LLQNDGCEPECPVDAIKITLSPAENARLTETTNMEAYDCSLRGREFLLGSAKSRDKFEQSKASFVRAIELDPSYAQAYAGLAFAYMFDYQNRWSDDPDGSLALSKHYAEQAIEKYPNDASRCGDGRNTQWRLRSGDVRSPNRAVVKPEFRFSLQRSWRHSQLLGTAAGGNSHDRTGHTSGPGPK
jgi:tetratricopeptide (TPR) repeat protein